MADDFISAPEAEARWPGRRQTGVNYLVDPDGNRWDQVRSALEGAFERVEGYRKTGMRVSTDQSDPGYTGVPSSFRVAHDGRLVENWITADSVEGRLVCYGLKGGPTVIAKDDPTRALTYELAPGVVVISKV